MNRSPVDVIRRGFDLTIANWQLLLIRIAEHVIFGIIAVIAIISIVVPIAVTAGLGHFDVNAPEAAADMIVNALVEHWMLWLFILLVIAVALLIFVLLHSFVQAGSAAVYAAGTFSGDRFMSGAKRGWVAVFGIYNIAWLVAGVIVLLPLIPVPLIILAGSGSPGTIVAGCLILALWAFFAIIVGIATAVWTMKAIPLAVIRNTSGRDALKSARRELRTAFTPHFAVAFVMIVLWIGGSTLIGIISAITSIGHATPLAVVTAPLHLLLTFINATFSTIVESWFLASFVVLSEP